MKCPPPELTEVERLAEHLGASGSIGTLADRIAYSLERCGLALSTKNELPSEVERTVNYLWQAAKAASETLRMMAEAKTARQTDRDDYPELAATGYSWPKPEETYEYKAAQTILSLQRRLDERDALLMEARAEIHTAAEASAYYDDAKECDRLNALLAKIDAALNPKDTGR
jgi:hypothetical protein